MSVTSNTPRIRFKQYSSNWISSNLSTISNIVTQKNVSNEYTDTFTNSAEFGLISQTEFFDNKRSNPKNTNRYLVVDTDDFVYNPRISTYAPVGPINRNTLTQTGIVSPLYFVFRLHSVDLTYMDYYFKTRLWHSFMLFNGDTGARSDRLAIKSSVFSQMPIRQPQDINEQKDIGYFLLHVDRVIQQVKNKTEIITHLKQTMLEKMFPKDGDDVPEIRFEGFNDSWFRCTFGDIMSLNSGKDYKHLHNGNIPVYGTGGYMLSVDDKLSDVDGVGIGRKGTIDHPILLKAPYWTVDTLYYMIPNKNISLGFLYTLSQTVKWKHYNEATGVPSLSKSNIDSIEILLPNKEEQLRISEYFNQLDLQLNKLNEKIHNLIYLKNSLLERMFM